MLDDMNHISNQLKGFYWYLLATIGSLGIAYKWALGALTNSSIEIKGNTLLLNKQIACMQAGLPDCSQITGFQNAVATMSTSSMSTDYKLIIVMLICLVGNLILWTICEYAISHGFLFRFIQTKTAKIERLFYANKFYHFRTNPLITLKKTNRDPSLKEQFFKDCDKCEDEDTTKCKEKENKTCLIIDHLLPDQFVPIYWGCLMLLVTNMAVLAFILMIHAKPEFSFLKNKLYALSWAGALSFPFIWKILAYYMYKTEKFITSTCEFKILLKNKKPFFSITKLNAWTMIFSALIGIVGFPFLNLINYGIMTIPIGIFSFYSLPVFIAAIVFLLRNVFLLRKLIEYKTPFDKNKNEYTYKGNFLKATWAKFEFVI